MTIKTMWNRDGNIEREFFNKSLFTKSNITCKYQTQAYQPHPSLIDLVRLFLICLTLSLLLLHLLQRVRRQ